MNYKIREIEKSDIAEMHALFVEFSEYIKLPEKMLNSIEKMEEEIDYLTGFVVQDKGEIIGYVTYYFTYYTWSGKGLYMDDLYVKPDYRGKGLGTELINKVIEFGKSSGCYKLKWEVSDWNKPAQEFYLKLGAEIDEVQKGCELKLI